MRTVNAEIAAVERDASADTIKSYRTTLSLKQSELDAHDKARPIEVVKPEDDPANPEAKRITEALSAAQNQFDDSNTKLNQAKVERASLVTRDALLSRLNGHIDNFENVYGTFIEETGAEFTEAGFTATDIVKLTVDREPIVSAAKQATDRLAEIAVLINGAEKEKGLEVGTAELQAAIAALQSELGAPQQRYQAYLAELTRWQVRRAEIVGAVEKPDTIEFLKARIEAAEKLLPTLKPTRTTNAKPKAPRQSKQPSHHFPSL